MNLRPILFLLLLLAAVSLHAQDTTSYGHLPPFSLDGRDNASYGHLPLFRPDEYDSASDGRLLSYKYWAIKLPLGNIIDLNSPSFQLAVERRFDMHNAIQLQGGPSVDHPANRKNGTVSGTFNGFRVRGEYRRYFKVTPSFAGYLAAELFYTKYTTAQRDSFSDTITLVGYDENYQLHKTSYGMNVKVGFHRSFVNSKGFMKHMMFDVYGGLGGKHRTVTQTGRSNPLDTRYRWRHPNVHDISNVEGDGGAFSMTLNFTIGYIFR